MTDPYSNLPAARCRRSAAALTVAAVVGTVLAPALATGPAAAAAACEEPLPYGASASADLLRLHALDLPVLGLGPVADVRIAATGAGMAADAAPGGVTSAAAARDVSANLLGLDLVGLVPVGELGTTVSQEAPPTAPDPVTHTGLELDLGVLAADVGKIEARASWDEAMGCGSATGTAGSSDASLLNAVVLPTMNGQALASLPDNLSSRTETGLVANNGMAAAHAAAAASLADLRLFAGSDSEIAVKVISEPTLEVTATGDAESSTVEYDSPILEISGPGIGTVRLEATGGHVDLVLPGNGAQEALPEGETLPVVAGDDPFGELVAGLDGSTLGELSAGGGDAAPPMELEGLPQHSGAGTLPLLGDVLPGVTSHAGLDGLSVLRLSIGALEEEIGDESVSASAASLRLQLLAWDGEGPAEPAHAVLDLGIGLLAAAATAPALSDPPPDPSPSPSPDPSPDPSPTPPPPGDDDDDDMLPVTGSSALGLFAGAGVLLAVAGRLLLLVGRGNRLNRNLLSG